MLKVTEFEKKDDETQKQYSEEEIDAVMVSKKKRLHPRPEDDEKEDVLEKKKKGTSSKTSVSVVKTEVKDIGKKDDDHEDMGEDEEHDDMDEDEDQALRCSQIKILHPRRGRKRKKRKKRLSDSGLIKEKRVARHQRWEKINSTHKPHLKRTTTSNSNNRVIKQRLTKITDQTHVEKIRETVLDINLLTWHAYCFRKLLLLKKYEERKELPITDRKFFLNILKVICERGEPKKKAGMQPKPETIALKNELCEFYLKDYEKFVRKQDINSYQNIIPILEYQAAEMEKNFKATIQQNYERILNRYLESIYDLKKTPKKDKKELRKKLRKLKKFIMMKDKIPEDEIAEKALPFIVPNNVKENIHYDISCNPYKYLENCIYMMKEVERRKYSLVSCLPLTSFKVNYIKFDTTTIAGMFINKSNLGDLAASKDDLFHRISEKKMDIWGKFFDLDNKAFDMKNKNFAFIGLMSTDGVGVSLHFQRRGCHELHQTNGAEKKKQKKNKFKEGESKRELEMSKCQKKEIYIDEIPKTTIDLLQLHSKRVVGIDPGKSDLVYCSSLSNQGQILKMSYSQNRRQNESKSRIIRRKLEKKKENTVFYMQSIKELETSLSKISKSTNNFSLFKEHVELASQLLPILLDFYGDFKILNMRLNAYSNRKRSEDKLLNRFCDTFGAPSETIIAYGDWEQRGNMKYSEPTKGKSFRDLFRRGGYSIFLVDEFKTSKLCSSCSSTLDDTQIKRPSSFWNPMKVSTLYRLKMCSTCNAFRNRDLNGSLNIRRIAISHIEGKGRPREFARTFNCSMQA